MTARRTRSEPSFCLIRAGFRQVVLSDAGAAVVQQILQFARTTFFFLSFFLSGFRKRGGILQYPLPVAILTSWPLVKKGRAQIVRMLVGR
jgi:hypothetical protein